MKNGPMEERVEAMSASLNYIYNENWSNQVDTNITHQLNHEKGIISLPAEDSTIVVDVSDPTGLIEVHTPERREDFTDSEDAAQFALKQFFTS